MVARIGNGEERMVTLFALTSGYFGTFLIPKVSFCVVVKRNEEKCVIGLPISSFNSSQGVRFQEPKSKLSSSF